MATKNEVAAQIMEHLCTHEWHGYSQPGRYGDGEGYCDLAIDGVAYRVAQGDRDCSSAIIDAYEAAGVDCGGATYTGNMRRCMCDTGNFEWVPMSYIAQRGDVYLSEVYHTAMCTSAVPDLMAQFSISETGGINGQVGDQTGWESSIGAYSDYPWDGILRYTGKADLVDAPAPAPHQVAGNPINDAGLCYRSHVAELGWLDPVRDGQTSGTVGYGLRLEAIKIEPPDGLEFDVALHIQDIGWRVWSDISATDPVIGTEGQSLRAEAIELRNIRNTTGKTLSCRVHLADYGWCGWVEAGFAAGTVGISRQIEAVQFKLA